MEKLGQDPAFPKQGVHSDIYGMSKRFYAACIAMQGILANSHITTGLGYKEGIAESAFKMADALLKKELND